MLTLAELAAQAKCHGVGDKSWRVRLILPGFSDYPDLYMYWDRWLLVMTDDAVRRVVAGEENRYSLWSGAQIDVHRKAPYVTGAIFVEHFPPYRYFGFDYTLFEANPARSFYLVHPLTGGHVPVELELGVEPYAECRVFVPERVLSDICNVWRE